MKLIEQIDIQPQNVKWLYDLHKKGLLEVDNSFQRNFVWTTKHQVQLLESILIGYPIPEIYIWNIGTDEDTGDTKYSIIDGQQRCGSIFQFISNTFKLNEKFLDSKSKVFDRIKNRIFQDLEADDKKAIWSYMFSVRLVRNNVPNKNIVDMFLRLNSNNMTLNPQELRNAEFEGEFMTLSSKLADVPFWDVNELFSIADRRRMRDISFISILLVFMKKGIEEDISSSNLNQIYDLYNNEYPSKEKDEERFLFVLNQINKIINNVKVRTNILKRQVHFYSLFTVVYSLTVDNTELLPKHIKNYQTFLDNYENDTELSIHFHTINEEILKYKALVKEGTGQKTNRFERFKCLKKVIEF